MTALALSKLKNSVPLAAFALSGLLVLGSATGAQAWHQGKKHSVVPGVVTGGAIGAIIGGAVKGKKGVLPGAAIGAVVGGAASAARANQAPPPPRPQVNYPPPSARDPLVYDIQASLKSLGYQPGPIDGVYGQMTANAIGAYEHNNQFPVTGQPSQAILQHMRSQLGG